MIGSGLEFERIGDRQLKGVPGVWDLYRFDHARGPRNIPLTESPQTPLDKVRCAGRSPRAPPDACDGQVRERDRSGCPRLMTSRITRLKHFVEVTGSGRRTLHMGSGDPLVLLHMGANPWSKWQPVLPYLPDRFEIIAPTLAGWEGGNPLAGPVTLDDLTRGVVEEMDRAGFRSAHIVGCSLGGLAALGVAREGRARSALAMCPAGGSNRGANPAAREAFRDAERSVLWPQRLLAPVVLSHPRMRRVGYAQCSNTATGSQLDKRWP